MERLHGRSAVIGWGKTGLGDSGQSRSEIGRLGNMPLDFTCRKSISGIGLLVSGDADGTVGMVRPVVMVMECSHQGGEEKEADKIE
jgi:hypothetical protein